MEHALAAYQNGAQVIISRGGTAAMIRNHIGGPILETRVTCYDVLRIVLLYRDDKKLVGIIGYYSVMLECRIASDLLKALSRQLTILLGNRVTLDCYRLEETVMQHIDAKVVLISNSYLYTEIKKKFTFDSEATVLNACKSMGKQGKSRIRPPNLMFIIMNNYVLQVYINIIWSKIVRSYAEKVFSPTF